MSACQYWPEDYCCLRCHGSMSVTDGMDPLEEDVRYCDSCAILEIEHLREQLKTAAADTVRMQYLAGSQRAGDGPAIEAFANVFNDVYCFIGDAVRKRIGEENDSINVEPTDADLLNGFRAMIDASIEVAKTWQEKED